jgi:hypothetical protein
MLALRDADSDQTVPVGLFITDWRTESYSFVTENPPSDASQISVRSFCQFVASYGHKICNLLL